MCRLFRLAAALNEHALSFPKIRRLQYRWGQAKLHQALRRAIADESHNVWIGQGWSCTDLALNSLAHALYAFRVGRSVAHASIDWAIASSFAR